jgi:hypothetical protein
MRSLLREQCSKRTSVVECSAEDDNSREQERIMSASSPIATAWAACEVGLCTGVTSDEARAAFLRELTDNGFVPSPTRQRAWQQLCGLLGGPPSEALLAEEARLRNEIDEFAASFFATPIAARRQRWQELSQRCASSPPLVARLQALRPGLDVELDPNRLGNPRLEQLASHVAGLFVLPPAARAAQRQAVLRTAQTDILGWEAAAVQLHATLPTLVALEPTLQGAILGWRGQQQRLARRREGRTSSAQARTPRPAPAATARAPSSSGSRALGGLAVFVILIVVRLCIGGLGSHRSYTPAPLPPPNFGRQAEPPGLNIKFEPADADDLERMRKAFEKMPGVQPDLDRAAKDLQERNKPGGRDGGAEKQPQPRQP